MNIVVEGIDNSGKSSLCEALAKAMSLPVLHSGGPPKHAGEIDERIARFLTLDRKIFDRHAAISQPIYATCRSGDQVSPGLIERFYATKPLIIYCDPNTRRLEGQKHNPDVDTPELQQDIDTFYDNLLLLYRVWAIAHAHVFYRIGDDVGRILTMTQSLKG